jgi:hypothetical protein
MEMNWNYVWAALAINFLLIWIVPRLIKKPTGIKVLDDLVLFLNSQKSSVLSSSIIIALVVWGAHYWVASAEGGAATRGSPPSPDF